MAPSRSLPTASYHQLRNRFDMWHCYKLWKNKRMFFRHEGYKGFYKGLAANLLRVTPACCITFYTYELLMQHLPELNVSKCISSSWYIYISPFRRTFTGRKYAAATTKPFAEIWNSFLSGLDVIASTCALRRCYVGCTVLKDLFADNASHPDFTSQSKGFMMFAILGLFNESYPDQRYTKYLIEISCFLFDFKPLHSWASAGGRKRVFVPPWKSGLRTKNF